MKGIVYRIAAKPFLLVLSYRRPLSSILISFPLFLASSQPLANQLSVGLSIVLPLARWLL